MVSTLIVVSVLSGTSIIAYLIWKKLIGSASVSKKIKDDYNDYSDISWNVSHVMTQEHIDLVESVEKKNLLLFITIKVPYGTSAMLYRNADAWESYRHTAGALSMFECRSTRYLAVGSPSGTAELIGIFGVTETQLYFLYFIFSCLYCIRAQVSINSNVLNVDVGYGTYFTMAKKAQGRRLSKTILDKTLEYFTTKFSAQKASKIYAKFKLIEKL